MVPYGAERAANELLSTNIKIIVSLGGGGGKDIPPPPPPERNPAYANLLLLFLFAMSVLSGIRNILSKFSM